MNKIVNPFLIKNYVSKDYFCNRDLELQHLYRNINNNINTTLISPRRMGKTGLIFRFFEHLSENNDLHYIYIDVYATRNLNDFINVLAETVLNQFSPKSSIGKRFMKLLKSLRPTFTFDALTGMPQVQFLIQNDADKENTLQKLLHFVDSQNTDVVIAFDEFQQITNYPENNVEALLRTCIQQLKQTHFIFCGSQKHTLTEMFMSAKRPFFSSTQILSLGKIDKSDYKIFIKSKFEQANKIIDDESVDYILDWTKTYTFYTQSICNRVFSLKNINIDIISKECLQLLKENESVYFQFRSLLTVKQWNFLIALAKEEEVEQLYSKDFLNKYDLGAPSSMSRIVQSLLEKEMILEQHNKNLSSYTVYDVFLLRWLQITY